MKNGEEFLNSSHCKWIFYFYDYTFLGFMYFIISYILLFLWLDSFIDFFILIFAHCATAWFLKSSNFFSFIPHMFLMSKPFHLYTCTLKEWSHSCNPSCFTSVSLSSFWQLVFGLNPKIWRKIHSLFFICTFWPVKFLMLIRNMKVILIMQVSKHKYVKRLPI